MREIGAPTEHLELWATDRERLVYAETYLFDVNGDYAGAMGYSDGDFGKQLYTSMFRLHVGGFGGVLVQLFYALLGAGLCLVCTTGIDIWLMKSAAKGKRHERLHRMWTAFVWGTPTLIAMAAALEIWVLAPLSMVFWIGLAALCLACGFAPLRQQTLARHAPGILGASIIALVAAHCLKFGMAAFTLAGAQINLPLLAIGFVFLGAPLMKRKVLIEAPVRTAPSAAE